MHYLQLPDRWAMLPVQAPDAASLTGGVHILSSRSRIIDNVQIIGCDIRGEAMDVAFRVYLLRLR
jgi:hypothetical protein